MNTPTVSVNGAYTRRLHPYEYSVYQTLQPLSTVNLVLPASDEINNLDWVKIETPDGKTEYYRVSGISTDTTTGDKTVYLEHGACLLDDTLLVGNSKLNMGGITGTITEILTDILTGQSGWTVGTVQATDTIYVEFEGMSRMTAILTMMQSIPDYQAEFVQASASDWHIDIKLRPTTPLCEGRLSRNLQTCEISYSTGDICTRVYAEGLTGGHMDSSNISEYGLHEQTMTLNENLSAAQKESIVTAYLDAHDHPSVSISISALELSQITGLTIDQFTIGTVCKVVIPWLNINQDEVIIDKRYSDPINDPENVTITLANNTPDLSITVAAITGGGGGGGGSAGTGGLLGQHKRYETKFEKTDQHFRLLATDTLWSQLEDGVEHGELTAYGQVVLTSSSFQATINAIGDGQGMVAGGNITPATIALAINAEGSEAYIAANHVRISGNIELNSAIFVGQSGVSGDFDYADITDCHATDLTSNIADINEANIGGLYVADGGTYYGATWKSKSVAVSRTITSSSVKLEKVGGGTIDTTVVTGVSFDTIYYLGR